MQYDSGMLCPVCSQTIENPTWVTCNRRECGDIYRKYGKVKVPTIDIKEIIDKIRSSRMKIHTLENEIKRLIYIKKLYDTTKNKKRTRKTLKERLS